METHPTESVSHTNQWGDSNERTYLRFSGGTPRSSKILVPISFKVVTVIIGETCERNIAQFDCRFTHRDVRLIQHLHCRCGMLLFFNPGFPKEI